ncbi:putative UDP-rhamnose:rhamnosyltransferase 1 [Cornus florida]|uniref:putative UDP-rhamnose:rhamnosyltransferase 1 n=1 Tax=Cornus florida TaxID=4283 RepID=UPI00289B6AA6|nr:putative UDP-rhamnose:rhamnosyltransferase 1 [Cornus florida]
MGRDDIHVVMLPWSAFGHIFPFLQLSFALAKAGVHVSLVSTPKNIRRLPKPPPEIAALIDLVELPLPAVDRSLLPVEAEATVDLPFDKIQYLKVAYDLLQQPFKQFIAERSPDWMIIDLIPHWAVEIAQEYRIPLLCFSAYSTATLVMVGPPEFLVGDGQKRFWSTPETMTSPPEWVSFPSSVAFRTHEAIAFHAGFFGENASGTSDAQRMAKVLHACQAIAIRTCKEFEGEYMKLEAKITGKPAIPVGLLQPERPPKEREVTDESWDKIFKWLDKQKPSSVVFVGFGSECKLSKEQVCEIANGLELSELPFLWALRKPHWAINDLDALPPVFDHWTSGRGVVHIGWAPQTDILAHQSIGGTLFHSGWGSAIESLQFGHCLVVLPLILDQGLNARLLVEKGLAIEVERSEDGSFSRNDIAKSLREAMVSEEGEQLRARAKEATAIFGDRELHDQYISEFVEYLRNGVAK